MLLNSSQQNGRIVKKHPQVLHCVPTIQNLLSPAHKQDIFREGKATGRNTSESLLASLTNRGS